MSEPHAFRLELARSIAAVFRSVGDELHVLGHIVGTDRVNGASPFHHGSDETVAASLLMRIASELVSASIDLFVQGRAYPASALLRQLVEVEYLAWAIQARSGEAERWLRSDQKQRQLFFTPAKLRKAASGTFRSSDYRHHCELGGHPVPCSALLLQCSFEIMELLVHDLLLHARGIWDHFVGWAAGNTNGALILKRDPQLQDGFRAWQLNDPLFTRPRSR